MNKYIKENTAIQQLKILLTNRQENLSKYSFEILSPDFIAINKNNKQVYKLNISGYTIKEMTAPQHLWWVEHKTDVLDIIIKI